MEAVGKLRFIQGFSGYRYHVGLYPPFCEYNDKCATRGIALYADDTKKGFVLCRAHQEKAKEEGLLAE